MAFLLGILEFYLPLKESSIMVPDAKPDQSREDAKKRKILIR